MLARLPEPQALENLMFRLVVFGFVTSAMMIVAGAFWADALWGSYWNWDPVESWSLVSWLIYAIFIHLRVIHHWNGRKLAWLAIVSFIIVIVSFWGSDYFSSSGHGLGNI